MEAPVNLYYKLTNFYLNQRDLVKSRSFKQLRGDEDNNTLSTCDGAKLVSEMIDNKNISTVTNQWGSSIATDSISIPCGLHAKSFFQGSIILTYRQLYIFFS